VSLFELPVVRAGPAVTSRAPAQPNAAWLRAARQAKLLAWASLAWMSVEGFVGVIAGVQAHSLGVVTWAASSFVEALASLIVVWRFSGRRTLSPTSEARAQKLVAASFFLLAPYFVVEAIRKLIDGSDTRVTGATSGEGIQNIMCAVQASTALVAVVGAGIGLSFLDPIAALVIAGIALKEGRDGWRGQDSCCTPISGLHTASASAALDGCEDDCCAQR
jgi:hypothetical protein